MDEAAAQYAQLIINRYQHEQTYIPKRFPKWRFSQCGWRCNDELPYWLGGGSAAGFKYLR